MTLFYMTAEGTERGSMMLMGALFIRVSLFGQGYQEEHALFGETISTLELAGHSHFSGIQMTFTQLDQLEATHFLLEVHLPQRDFLTK